MKRDTRNTAQNKNGSRCNLFIKHHATSHNKRTANKRRKVAAISTLLYKVRNKHT